MTAPTWTFPGCPATPGQPLDFDGLLRRYPVLRPMASCPQDPVWHAEGDVLTHTRMVCQALIASEPWRQLELTPRSILFAAALFHDVAKPLVTKLEDGRLRSRNHAVRGARVVRRMLMEAGPAVPFDVRESVVALVRHHGLPATLADKPDPVRSLLLAAATARCDWLAILAAADSAGRICRAPDDSPARLELFRGFAFEHGCIDGPYPFASPASRVRYFRTAGSPPTQQVFDAAEFEVTLMAGLPASGKDHFLARRYAGPVVSLDDIRTGTGIDPAGDQNPVVAEAKEQAKSYLRQRQSFAWNATNTGRPLRDGLIGLFLAYGARVRIVWCDAPPAVLRDRNRRRPRPVPDFVIDKLLDHLDMPDETEAHSVVTI
jgi:putative nucleotidyltransferase with HDIG domain